MKKCLALVLMLFCVAFVTSVTAAEFAPLFTVKDITGTATIDVPGSDGPVPIEAGRAYPYGSTIRTDSGTSLNISFSDGNAARINGNSVIALKQDSDDGSIKVIHLHSGRIDLNLEEGFEANNGLEILTRCCSIVALKGGSSSVDAKAEGDLKVTVIKVTKGELEASGPSYNIPLLTDNNAVTVSCSDDRSFVRIRDLEGDYGIEIDDEDGATRLVEMEKDSVIKILRKPSDVDSNVLIVTILEINSDGEIVSATTFSTASDGDGPIDPPPPPPGTAPPEDTLGGPGPTIGSTTSSSSTSTTSSTAIGGPIPPPPPATRPRPRRRPPTTPPGAP